MRADATMVLTAAFGLTSVGFAYAQGNQIVMREQHARSLKGVVLDPPGGRVEGVEVAECSANFKYCATITRTDVSGRFVIQSRRPGSTHYLRFSLPGFNEECETVKLSLFASSLIIILSLGT